MEPIRRELPNERETRCRHFSVAGYDGYLHVDLYPDGRPGELRITMTKPGSVLRGLMDAVAAAISTGLQHGVPLRAYQAALGEMQFEPAGYTNDPDVQRATSLVAYVLARLAVWFPDAAPAPAAEGPPLAASAAIEPAAAPEPGCVAAPSVAQPAATGGGTTAVPPATTAVPPARTHEVVNELLVPIEFAEVVRRSFASWPSGPTPETWSAVTDGRNGGTGRPHHDDVHACPRPWWAHGDRRAYCTCPATTASES